MVTHRCTEEECFSAALCLCAFANGVESKSCKALWLPESMHQLCQLRLAPGSQTCDTDEQLRQAATTMRGTNLMLNYTMTPKPAHLLLQLLTACCCHKGRGEVQHHQTDVHLHKHHAHSHT
jgi:hypothetical protein